MVNRFGHFRRIATAETTNRSISGIRSISYEFGSKAASGYSFTILDLSNYDLFLNNWCSKTVRFSERQL